MGGDRRVQIPGSRSLSGASGLVRKNRNPVSGAPISFAAPPFSYLGATSKNTPLRMRSGGSSLLSQEESSATRDFHHLDVWRPQNESRSSCGREAGRGTTLSSPLWSAGAETQFYLTWAPVSSKRLLGDARAASVERFKVDHQIVPCIPRMGAVRGIHEVLMELIVTRGEARGGCCLRRRIANNDELLPGGQHALAAAGRWSKPTRECQHRDRLFRAKAPALLRSLHHQRRVA
jgi:hypothetical protein